MNGRGAAAVREALDARGIPVRGNRFRCPLCSRRPGGFSGSFAEDKSGAALVRCCRCAPGGPGGRERKERLLVALGFGPRAERRRLFAAPREARGNYAAPTIPKEKPSYSFVAFDGSRIKSAVRRRPGWKDCPWYRFEAGRWVAGLAGRVPRCYMPENFAAAENFGRLLFLAEGARKAEAFTCGGALAVGLPNGANVSRDVLAELVRFPGVLVPVPDNDAKGRGAMKRIALARWHAGRETRIVFLPGADFLGFDVLDFLARGGRVADVLRLAEAAPAWAPSAVERAARWVREFLAAGPVPAGFLAEKGAALGFGVRLLRRARLRAGVKCWRLGFGRGAAVYVSLASASFLSEAAAVRACVAS